MGNKVGDTEVDKNLLMSVKNCAPEEIRCFDASNGTLPYSNLKIYNLNGEVSEAKAK